MRRSPGWLREALDKASSLKQIGVLLWYLVRGPGEECLTPAFLQEARDKCPWMEKMCPGSRVTRKKRALFPLPSFGEEPLRNFPKVDGWTSLFDPLTVETFWKDCWCELVVLFCNHMHENKWEFGQSPPTKPQEDMLLAIKGNVERVVGVSRVFKWDSTDVADDVKKKLVSYTGEEVARPCELTIHQVIPALPPEDHGGRIPVEDWVNGRCKWYLENPDKCLVTDTGQDLPRLQGRVHVKEDEKIPLAKLLVQRRICRWVHEDKVIKYRGQKVLNGLFGVPKAAQTPGGEPILRLIMNLVPSNSILKTLKGKVARLPNICSWNSIVLEQNELLSVCQSDMTSAFYLFSVPQRWSELLCFGISVKGKEIQAEQKHQEDRFYLGCGVLPMGWSSAVGVMQFIAEEALLRRGMPTSSQLHRLAPLPEWMTTTCTTAESQQKFWWHVYLDNYASGEKVEKGNPPIGDKWQTKVEDWWEAIGIVTSKKKTVTNATEASELGAYIDGSGQWIGGSCERLLKLCKTTLWALDHGTLGKKALQIVMGRWVFVLQFRRPAMSHFEAVWEWIGGKKKSTKLANQVKQELLSAIWAIPLLHTFLGARLDTETTCSDASNTGGAVAFADELSSLGKQYLMTYEPSLRPVKVPVVVVSLFNGIGGSFRSFDVAGAQLAGGIAVDIHKPANRITSRRWPWVQIWDDVRTFTKEVMEDMLEDMEPFDEIQVWMGFPCVDLSAVKHGRANLRGSQSSLFFEGKRVMKDLKSLYPKKTHKHVVENVSSMDTGARDEISEHMGDIPYKLDPSKQIPMSRPRFCWTNVEIGEMEGSWLEEKDGYVEIHAENDWPDSSQWLTPNCWQNDEEVIYPTCMKSIRRDKPPMQPAGLARCDWATTQRWIDNGYRYPPYQYKSQYLIWDEKLQICRLLNSSEREVLLGYGIGHTELCFSASKVKQNKTAFEDERCSLLGDSFAIASFSLIAAWSVKRWIGEVSVEWLTNRLGLPPGGQLTVDMQCPMTRELTFNLEGQQEKSVHNLHAFLARRTNHTGSDVRICSGELMNNKSANRQSVSAGWWKWKPAFSTHWEFPEHINPLEARAVLLSLIWKARNRRICNRRLFHLTDSYVVQSILAKGRTSSKMLQPVVRRINAVLLASCGFLFVLHVDSSDNPTDGASRL